jgi:hypothetical protein
MNINEMDKIFNEMDNLVIDPHRVLSQKEINQKSFNRIKRIALYGVNLSCNINENMLKVRLEHANKYFSNKIYLGDIRLKPKTIDNTLLTYGFIRDRDRKYAIRK